MATINTANFSNHVHTPPRWKINADYMTNSRPTELALLNAADEAYYQYVNASVGAFYSPNAVAAFSAKSVGVNVQFFLTSTETVYQPLTWYYTLSSIIPYVGTPPTAPTSAVTSFATSTVFGVIGTIANAGLVAGSDVVVALQAASLSAPVSPAQKSPVQTFRVIFAPAAPTSIAAADGTGSSSVSWTVSSGATSYTIYWKSGSLVYTAAQILAAPTGSVAGTTPAGQTITLAATTYSFTITATNPGGTSLGGTADGATVS
jgi:hypothetical protein